MNKLEICQEWEKEFMHEALPAYHWETLLARLGESTGGMADWFIPIMSEKYNREGNRGLIHLFLDAMATRISVKYIKERCALWLHRKGHPVKDGTDMPTRDAEKSRKEQLTYIMDILSKADGDGRMVSDVSQVYNRVNECVEVKTSEEWYTEEFKKEVGTIMDPDGWDRTNFQYSWYEEKITEQEFNARAMASTGIWKLRWPAKRQRAHDAAKKTFDRITKKPKGTGGTGMQSGTPVGMV